MSGFWKKLQDLFAPQGKYDETETTPSVENPICVRCRAEKCKFLTEFMMLEPVPLNRESGVDMRYSVWQCPTCMQYYVREWLVDWKSGSLEPAPYQFILTYALPERLAQEILELVPKCPNPMTRSPEKCKCALHEQLELPHIGNINAIWSDGQGELVERVAFPDSARHQLLTFGVDQYQVGYQRKRKT